jgi:hypothetical protein
MSNNFDYKTLDQIPRDKKRISMYREGDVVHQAILEVKKFLFGWRSVADLMEPVRKKDNEIKEQELKLKKLKDERDTAWRQAVLVINSVRCNIEESKSYKLSKDDLKVINEPFKDSSKSDKKGGVDYVELVGTMKPQHNNQNGGGKNRNNNQNNH